MSASVNLRLAAGDAVARAVKRGELIRPKRCENCLQPSAKAIHAHHHLGYEPENWLKVKWLCRRCHTEAHNKVYGRPLKITPNAGFPCPRCGRGTAVVDSRPSPAHDMVRRRRVCAKRHRFTTYEAVGHPHSRVTPLRVQMRAILEQAETMILDKWDRVVADNTVAEVAEDTELPKQAERAFAPKPRRTNGHAQEPV